MTVYGVWAGGGVSLHIGYLPGRKSAALYTYTEAGLTVLAYFKDEATARLARSILTTIITSTL